MLTASLQEVQYDYVQLLLNTGSLVLCFLCKIGDDALAVHHFFSMNFHVFIMLPIN